jgi:hypothetical protein
MRELSVAEQRYQAEGLDGLVDRSHRPVVATSLRRRPSRRGPLRRARRRRPSAVLDRRRIGQDRRPNQHRHTGTGTVRNKGAFRTREQA